MEVVVLPTADAAVAYAHGLIVEHLKAKPSTVLGLPTGATPLGVYVRLVESYRSGEVSWRSVTTFNLDEYWGLGEYHPTSYAAYMRRVLFDHVDCPLRQRHIPNGCATDAVAEARGYEASIDQAGGIDMLLLGLGRNAHIGFNEPGSPFTSRTRLVDLAPSTLAANKPHFASGEEPPGQAISMGIATILQSRKIVVLATGGAKAEAVRRSIREEPNVEVPGSALQLAQDVTFVVDEAAAGA